MERDPSSHSHQPPSSESSRRSRMSDQRRKQLRPQPPRRNDQDLTEDEVFEMQLEMLQNYNELSMNIEQKIEEKREKTEIASSVTLPREQEKLNEVEKQRENMMAAYVTDQWLIEDKKIRIERIKQEIEQSYLDQVRSKRQGRDLFSESILKQLLGQIVSPSNQLLNANNITLVLDYFKEKNQFTQNSLQKSLESYQSTMRIYQQANEKIQSLKNQVLKIHRYGFNQTQLAFATLIMLSHIKQIIQRAVKSFDSTINKAILNGMVIEEIRLKIEEEMERNEGGRGIFEEERKKNRVMKERCEETRRMIEELWKNIVEGTLKVNVFQKVLIEDMGLDVGQEDSIERERPEGGGRR